MTRIVYYFFYILSLLPLRILYGMADFEYLIIYHIIKYRRKVVNENIATAFPDKNKKEIRYIEKGFYHWFADYFFEAVKLLSISDRELRRRFKIVNSEEVEKCFQEGQDVATILGHYCNWEWLSCIGIDLPQSRIMGLVYHPLRNSAFDNLFKQIRSSQPNGVTVPKKDILRFLLNYRRNGTRNIFGYISDQGPKWENIHLWLPFLNHPETPVFTGAERIMRKMNDAVFYVEMSRPKRGYYTATYKLITKDPNSLPEYEITKRFFGMLEETINKEPRYYLWTHKRWKRTREEFDRKFQVVNGKVIAKNNNDD